jgi:hypothetical protein
MPDEGKIINAVDNDDGGDRLTILLNNCKSEGFPAIRHIVAFVERTPPRERRRESGAEIMLK